MKRIILSAILALGLGLSASADVNLGACMGCHGKTFEKKALGKSKVVSDMNSTSISQALIGYKDGTYGGQMKVLMKGQVAKYSIEQLQEIANQIKPTDSNESNSSK